MTATFQETLSEATQRLVTEFQPEQIWLFGSHAWGEPGQDSDLDLMVIVTESDESPVSRAQRAHRSLIGLGIPKDVLVKTRAEFDRFRNVVSSLTYKVSREGRLVYG